MVVAKSDDQKFEYRVSWIRRNLRTIPDEHGMSWRAELYNGDPESGGTLVDTSDCVHPQLEWTEKKARIFQTRWRAEALLNRLTHEADQCWGKEDQHGVCRCGLRKEEVKPATDVRLCYREVGDWKPAWNDPETLAEFEALVVERGNDGRDIGVAAEDRDSAMR